MRWWFALRALRPPRQRLQGRQLRTAHDRASARAGSLRMVADQRLTPDVHVRSGRVSRRRGGGGRPRTAPHHERGRVLLARVHRGDHGDRRHGRPGRAGRDGAAARRRRPSPQRRADDERAARGLAPLRPWREALEDYMAQRRARRRAPLGRRTEARPRCPAAAARSRRAPRLSSMSDGQAIATSGSSNAMPRSMPLVVVGRLLVHHVRLSLSTQKPCAKPIGQ